MKKRITSFVLAIIMLVSVGALLFSCSDESVDYIASVKAIKPYEDYGISATYGTVLNKYISSCKWQERIQSKNLTYVDVSGKIADIDGSQIEVAITFKVTPYEGKTEGMVWVEAYLVEIDGNSYQSDRASAVIEELFDAYNEGFESYAAYLIAYGEDW